MDRGSRTAAWPASPSSSGRWDEGAPVAYIQTIEVAVDERRQGVGDELLRRVEASARAAGARTIWLHVDAGKLRGDPPLRRRGYASQGREEHYYARNRAALIYSKKLAQSDPLRPLAPSSDH